MYKRSKISSINDKIDGEDDDSGPTNYIAFLGEEDELIWATVGNVMIEMIEYNRWNYFRLFEK